MGAKKIIVLLVTILTLTIADGLNTNSFPDDFLFGVATASYQIEGAWNESDKAENIWDYMTHNYPEQILDKSSGDTACDSYHHTNDDVELMKNLGVDFYRFSISWPRLLPTSYSNKVSETGLNYYNGLINALVAANITPMVTLYHWDLPSELQKLGGWANPIMADYYADYVTVAFEKFGDRVKHWITFNEPQSFCGGYDYINLAPVNVLESGIGEYLCIYTMLKAHAKAYHIYDEKYRSTQNGMVGITLVSLWYEPNTTSSEDAAAAERMLQFSMGLYAHPIFGKGGDYPEIVKAAVANRSALEGFPYSRLQELTDEEIEYINGTADFFGANHYSTMLAAAGDAYEIGEPAMAKDKGVTAWYDSSWEGGASTWLKVVPWGFKKYLLWLHNEYGYPIYITENGFSDLGEMEDYKRISYYQEYLSALLDALDEGANVRGYTAWSLMDNFEWLDGYVNRFGLHYVNMSDPARPRTIKQSGEYYKQVIATRKVTTDALTTNAPTTSAPTTSAPTTSAPTTSAPTDRGFSIVTLPISLLLLFAFAPALL